MAKLTAFLVKVFSYLGLIRFLCIIMGVRGRGGRSTKRVLQAWYPLHYNKKVRAWPDSLPKNADSHSSFLIKASELKSEGLDWIVFKNGELMGPKEESARGICLRSPAIRQREDWRLIYASQIKFKAQGNPNYCAAMTHLSLIIPMRCLPWVFHKTRSKLRMPALSLRSWSREGVRHGDTYSFCPWTKCTASRLL